MVHDPSEERLFPTLPAEALECLRENGRELEFDNGQFLFREGDRLQHFYVVLEGRVRVTKRMATDQQLLAVHEPGQFTGEISMFAGEKALATGQAIGRVRVIEVQTRDLPRLSAECPKLGETIFTAMSGRANEVSRVMLQQEKLASLGKLSAGLAHELNNPAAAASRAVSHLREAILRVQRLSLSHDSRLDEGQRATALRVQQELETRTATELVPLDPVARSDREQEIGDWLDEHSVPDPWDLAPSLVEAGVTTSCLNDLGQALQGEALQGVLTWLDATLRMDELARAVQSSTERISGIVAAMKDYTYMDQAALQEVDIHQGIETTLKIFSDKLKGGIQVQREYDRTLPKVCAYGGELNQVWTNLIDNALDAMNGKGTLTVRTAPSCEGVLVTVADTGPGIPTDIQNKVFDPFFTTKPVGQGTGLGLDTTHRIVVARHGGAIKLHSAPGDTRFEITLPLQPPKEEHR